MDLPEIDTGALASGLFPEVQEAVAPFLRAEANDVQTYAWRISEHFAFAIQNGDAQWTHELQAQLRGLLELTSVRVGEAEMAGLERVLGMIFRVGVAALAATIKGGI